MFLWWQALYIQRLGVSIVSFEDVDLLGFTSNYAVIAPGRTSSDIIPSQLNIVFHLYWRKCYGRVAIFVGSSIPRQIDKMPSCHLKNQGIDMRCKYIPPRTAIRVYRGGPVSGFYMCALCVCRALTLLAGRRCVVYVLNCLRVHGGSIISSTKFRLTTSSAASHDFYRTPLLHEHQML